MESKGKPIPEFTDEARLSDLGFLTDLTLHLNDLNKKLQGKDNLVPDLYDALKAFAVKLDLWIKQFKESGLMHFPHLSSCKITNVEKYISVLQELKSNFETRFVDFRKN